VGDSVNILRWAYMHPLPIGRQALIANREVDNQSEWSEVLNVLPFEGHETALWALRVKVGGSLSSRSVLPLGSVVQNTMNSEVRFRAELSTNGAERLELTRV
jgi:hypothetical protein